MPLCGMNEASSLSPIFRISQIRMMASKSSHLPKPHSAQGKRWRNRANWERHEALFSQDE